MEDLKEKSYEELISDVDKNAEGLSITKGTKVHGLLLNTAGFEETTGDWVVAYYKSPDLYQRMTIMDSLQGENKTLKGWQLFEKNVIKENSDMKYFDKRDPKNIPIIMGAALHTINNSIAFSVNHATDLKKNGE